MLAAGRGEGAEGFFVTGSDETEIGIAWVKKVILVFGVAEGTFGRWSEASLEDSSSIDEEAGRVASAQEETVSSGGKINFGRGAE